MKRILLSFVVIFTLTLYSCTKQIDKTAYCFSMVFERNSDLPTITLYCKTHGREKSDFVNTPLSFQANSFKNAFESAEKSEYSIYYNSTKALYFENNLSYDDYKEVAEILLNNTKYQTSVGVYTPKNKNYTKSELHNTALSVCKDETIPKNKTQDYTKALKFFRNILK